MNLLLWDDCETEGYLRNLRRRETQLKGSRHSFSEYLSIFEPKIVTTR